MSADHDDEKQKRFREAFMRMPPPIRCFSDGAACPWCGHLHVTVTFGANECSDCNRSFHFGYPDWDGEKDPVSWCPFPRKAWRALGERPEVIEEWTPNERLKHIHFEQTEEELGTYAHASKTQ